MRHAKSGNISLGSAWRQPKKSPGRPVKDEPAQEPTCKVCRNLEVGSRGGVRCGRGHELDASRCGADFKSAATERHLLGGTSG